MLFTYKELPSHAMVKMHEYVDFIFHNIWCQAPENQFDLALFSSHPDLLEIMQELERKDHASTKTTKEKEKGAGYRFLTQVNLIHNEFRQLKRSDILIYRRIYKLNNDVAKLCQRDGAARYRTYETLPRKHPKLNAALKKFYQNLYSSGFFALKTVKGKIGSDLKGYYRDFVTENSRGLCPFCGLLPLDGKFSKTREDYDHFLPKGKFPFNSVSLRNLAPSCGKCNSGHKGRQDPLRDDSGVRRKVIDPFGKSALEFKVNFSLKIKDWENMTPAQFNLSLSSATHEEETETWKDLYGVEGRYADFLCSSEENVGCHYWYTQVLDEWREDGRTPEDYLITLRRQTAPTAKSRHAETKFLKLPFLEACYKAGLFS